MDVTAGTIVLMIFFCQELNVHFYWQEYTILGIVVWLIYTIDHLKDVNKLDAPTSNRRRFHSKHFKPLLIVSAFVAVIASVLVFFLPEKVVLFGALVGSISGFYLFVSKRIDWFKEFWVAITYSFGVLLVPIVRVGFDESTILLLGSMILLALINLLLFSHFEQKEDEEEGFRSFANVMGNKLVETTLALSFLLLGFVLYGIWLAMESTNIAVFITLTSLLYLCIWQVRWFRTNERYRIFGDAIFIAPIIFILA